MTPADTRLIRETFATLTPQADRLVGFFYDRLFSQNPELRLMFPKSLDAQRAKLVAALTHVVANLEATDTLVADLRAMGARHRAYGVTEPDYAHVGRALIEALAHVLGAAFTLDAERAWTRAYDTISGAMIEGARDARVQRVA